MTLLLTLQVVIVSLTSHPSTTRISLRDISPVSTTIGDLRKKIYDSIAIQGTSSDIHLFKVSTNDDDTRFRLITSMDPTHISTIFPSALLLNNPLALCKDVLDFSSSLLVITNAKIKPSSTSTAAGVTQPISNVVDVIVHRPSGETSRAGTPSQLPTYQQANNQSDAPIVSLTPRWSTENLNDDPIVKKQVGKGEYVAFGRTSPLHPSHSSSASSSSSKEPSAMTMTTTGSVIDSAASLPTTSTHITSTQGVVSAEPVFPQQQQSQHRDLSAPPRGKSLLSSDKDLKSPESTTTPTTTTTATIFGPTVKPININLPSSEYTAAHRPTTIASSLEVGHGSTVKSSVPTEIKQETTHKQKSKRILIVLVVIIVILLVGLGTGIPAALGLFNKSSTSASSSSSSPSSSSSLSSSTSAAAGGSTSTNTTSATTSTLTTTTTTTTSITTTQPTSTTTATSTTTSQTTTGTRTTTTFSSTTTSSTTTTFSFTSTFTKG